MSTQQDYCLTLICCFFFRLHGYGNTLINREYTENQIFLSQNISISFNPSKYFQTIYIVSYEYLSDVDIS